MEFRVLGELEVSDGSGPIGIGGAKQRAVLSLLLMNANRVVSTDRLIDGIWEGRPPERAQAALQVYVSQLRKSLRRETIETHSGGYLLAADAGAIDADRFETLVERGRGLLADDPAAAARTLREALALWRGRAYDDVADLAAARTDAARLEDLRLTALEERIEADLAGGRSAELVSELEALVATEPLRERLQAQLMLALYRSGRQADALAAFRTARSALLDELGLDPSPRLQALERAILSQDEALEVASARRVAPSNVPVPPNALVGRERELKELVDLCRADDIRLVTLTGPGGVGKTRLAVAVAAASTKSFDGRVYFVDLAPVRDPQLVLAALADPLEIREAGPRTLQDALVGHVRGVRVLLVVDNFEQVQAAATLVGDLLAAAPTLTVLVTSRTRLRLAGEQEYAVQPLPRDDALALFAARAHAVRATAKIDESPAVELCRRLDHLPLAIELAAARTRLLSPSALLERLDRRLEVLGEGPRDLPARQRTLRATLDWSYDLLGPDEQATFERLAVFVAGCSVKAAEAVTDASLESLEALVDGSLAVERGGRIEMLATMREYGLERLAARGELDEVRRRHATYLAELAAHADTQIDSSDQSRWFDELELEHDDLRAALAWAIDRPEPELALRIAADSGWFWFVRGHLTDGRRWLEASLALTAPSATEPRAKALMRLGALAEAQGDYPAAAGAYEGAVVLQSTLGDEQRLVAARTNLGNIAYYRREYERAAALYEESLEEARRADDELGIAALLCNLALVRVTQGRPEEGKELLDESLILARRLDDPYGVANVLQALGAALADLGQLDAAAAALRESLELFHTLDERTETAVTLEELAGVAAESEPEAATALLGAARAIRDAIHAAPTGPNDDRSARTLERIRACLSDAEVERALADGRATPPAALAEIVLARLEARSASSRA